MTFDRIWQSLRISLIRSNEARADYIKKKNLYGAVGENCAIKRRKIPLYSKLIRIGDNVRHGSVTFLTHDNTYRVFNRDPALKEIYGKFSERIGCIEIGNNVFIGSGVTILYNTKIGSNVVIGTGSIVTHDIPDNSVVVGVPARVIGTYTDLAERMKVQQYPVELKPKGQKVSDALAKYMWDKFDREHS